MGKFFRRGKTQVLFVPTIASATKAPTVAELGTGTALGASINDMNGFSFANQPIDTPTLADEFTGKIGGEDQAEDSSFTFYLDDTTNPLRTTLAKGVNGFVVIADFKVGALVAADVVDVWPSRATAAPKQYSLGNDPALWLSQWVHPATPALDIAVLA